MVGVPGRSKGCHTCKQRRIRCHEERPNCSNCIKSKRTCGGYLRNHAFILSQDMLPLDLAPSQAISDSNPESGELMVARWRIDPTKPPQRASNVHITSLYHQHPQFTNRLTLQISSRHAGRQQMIGSFASNYLPSEVLNDNGQIIRERYWLLKIQDAPSLTPALEFSILAVCMAKLGRKHNDEALVRKSLSMYTAGLHQLRQAVRNPKVRCHNETIAACLALIMFESTECPAQSIESCLAHFRGAINLLLLRRPEEYASGLAHCMYQELRIQSVFIGMKLRSKTVLADIEWCDLPWKSSQKGLRDLLIDLLLEMPEIYHRMDEVGREKCLTKILPGLIDIADLCWQIDMKLNKWYTLFETYVGGPLYWPKLSTSVSSADNTESGKVFAVAFHFPSYDVAHAMILYWLALLLVHPILCLIYEQIESFVGMGQKGMKCSCSAEQRSEISDIVTPISSLCPRHITTNKLPPLGFRTQWAGGPARNICQSAEYVMQEEMGEMGITIMLGRILMVREFLVYASGDWTRELRWIADLMNKIQGKGNNILKYI